MIVELVQIFFYAIGGLQLAAILIDIAKYVHNSTGILHRHILKNVDNTLVMISSSKMHQQMEN